MYYTKTRSLPEQKADNVWKEELTLLKPIPMPDTTKTHESH